ncbi:hypothetical protein BJY52DRAFT_1279056, partial [Lactarius psammicola]
RPTSPPIRSQPDADLPMSVPSRHGSPLPQRTSHLPVLLRPHGRIIGLRPMNGIPHDATVTDLCKRVQHLVVTCNDRSLFANDKLWSRRARGCIETVASLVFCANIKPELFGDLGRLLGELGRVEKIRERSAAGSDGSFVTRWTCLSFLVVARGIFNHDTIKQDASAAIDKLSQLQSEDDGDLTSNGDGDDNALKKARIMDDCLTTVSKIPQLREIPPLHFGEVTSKDDSKDDSIEYVRLNYAADIHKLIHIPKQDQLRRIDATIAPIDDRIRSATPGLVPYLPGVLFDTFKMSGDIGESEFSRYSTPEEQTFIPQFISLYQRLGELCNHADRVQYLQH